MILSVCLDTQVHHLCHNDGCCQLSKLLMPNSRLIAPRRVSQRRRSRRRAPYYDPRPPRVAWTARIGTPNRCPSARPSWPVPARRRSRRRATYYAPRPPCVARWRLRGRKTYYAPHPLHVAGNARHGTTHCCTYARPLWPVRATRNSGPARRRGARPSGRYHADALV